MTASWENLHDQRVLAEVSSTVQFQSKPRPDSADRRPTYLKIFMDHRGRSHLFGKTLTHAMVLVPT
jgi:hypothetical protein